MNNKLVNLIKWLDKKEIENSIVTYGENNYFFSAGYVYDVVSVELSADDIQGIRSIENCIYKYCNRYNLDVFYTGKYNLYYDNTYHLTIRIRTYQDKTSIENYYYYRDQSVSECEQLIHEYHIAGIYKSHCKELNNLLKGIMNKYEYLYKQSLNQAISA